MSTKGTCTRAYEFASSLSWCEGSPFRVWNRTIWLVKMINVWYILQLRLQAIKRCEETIMNAIRQGDPNVIQAGCVTQWNLILALLQPNLRKHVRKPLTLLADALEDIQRYMYGATWFWNINRLMSETCSLSILIWKEMFLLIFVANLVQCTVKMSHLNEYTVWRYWWNAASIHQ